MSETRDPGNRADGCWHHDNDCRDNVAAVRVPMNCGHSIRHVGCPECDAEEASRVSHDAVAHADMSLVERLRFGCPFKPYSAEDGVAAYDVPKAERVMLEAADYIERLERDLSEAHHIRRWNIREDGAALIVCRGDHDRGADCEETRFVPEASLSQDTVLREREAEMKEVG